MIKLYSNRHQTFEVQILDASNKPFNLTGCTVYFTAKSKEIDTTPFIFKSSLNENQIKIIDAEKGLLEIYIVPSDTALLKRQSSYYFDITVKTTNDKVYTVYKDILVIELSVSNIS